MILAYAQKNRIIVVGGGMAGLTTANVSQKRR